MSEAKLPAIGTRAVHKEDHAKQTGPVWEVYGIDHTSETPVALKPAKHKINAAVSPGRRRHVTGEEFNDDYVVL
jgi:hypothetical protein